MRGDKLSVRLMELYHKLYASYGPQGWWPADTAFEVMAGAILTQNTSWQNVERALANLKTERLLVPSRLYALPYKTLARLIRPAGYYNLKARRLKNFLEFFAASYQFSCKRMAAVDTSRLRGQLLGVKGIGPETADSILLYALGKPVFVVDSYTKRVLFRHRLTDEDISYQDAQRLFTDNLKPDAALFNQYHALIVRLAKDYCRLTNPRCRICPLK